MLDRTFDGQRQWTLLSTKGRVQATERERERERGKGEESKGFESAELRNPL